MKNKILKATAWIMGFLFLLSGSALNSISWIPFVVCVGSGAWLALFAYANNMFRREGSR